MTVVITALMAATLAQSSEPYVRSRARVDPTKYAGTPHCLWWPEGTAIGWTQNELGDDDVGGSDELTAVSKAYGAWQAVLDNCGNLTLPEGPRTASRVVGYEQNASTNENIILFRKKSCANEVGPSAQCWRLGTCRNLYDCWEDDLGVIAITTVSYEPESGRIFDADIEMNSFTFRFSVSDTPCTLAGGGRCADIQNTVTHEVGHLLGLDHTLAAGSTMNPKAPDGELSKRNVDPGSTSFVCEAYPKGSFTRDCVVNEADPVLGDAARSCAGGVGGPSLALLSIVLAWGRRRRA